MSRHDKEDLKDFDFTDIEYQVQNYHEDGSTTDKFSDDKTIVAKFIYNPETEFERYMIKSYGGALYDFTNKLLRYRRQTWKMRTVSKDAFLLYLQYLGITEKQNRGKTQFLRKAERLQ